jgi:hypothetical protein
MIVNLRRNDRRNIKPWIIFPDTEEDYYGQITSYTEKKAPSP